MPPSQIQAIIDEYRFRIVRKIADGGMGSVYEAIQDGANGFQKTVAIKTILPDFADSGTYVGFFVQEAKLVADLVHENIVQTYQLGRTLGGYYIVMEYVKGLSLADFIRHHKLRQLSIPLPLAVFIVSRIARGLTYAHNRTDAAGENMRIVHRDVCPGNILVTTEGLPKLTDFGTALVAGDLATAKKREQLVGKLPYMAPEQARREQVDFRSDIYSLGAVFFELLAGERVRPRRLDAGASAEEPLAAASEGKVRWEVLPDELPQPVRDILERCLAPRREARYSRTAELARELEYYIYKDGYGPTIQTLEDYLREHLPHLYVRRKTLSLGCAAQDAPEKSQHIATTFYVGPDPKEESRP